MTASSFPHWLDPRTLQWAADYCELMGIRLADVPADLHADRRGSIWHGRDLICRPCFWTWYEYGIVERVELATKRLELYGRRDG
jgi:hypothetical protein